MSASSVPPGKVGVYASFGVVALTIFASLVVQNYVAADIDNSAWEDHCPDDYKVQCKENGSVYRMSFALVILFLTQIVGTIISPSYFDSFWPFKITLYILLVFAFYFTPGNVFDTNGYAWFARLAAAAFIVLQQVIYIECFF